MQKLLTIILVSLIGTSCNSIPKFEDTYNYRVHIENGKVTCLRAMYSINEATRLEDYHVTDVMDCDRISGFSNEYFEEEFEPTILEIKEAWDDYQDEKTISQTPSLKLGLDGL